MTDHSSSFSAHKINSTTFVIREHDVHEYFPLVYAKLHPTAPVLILSDVGSDSPFEKYQNARFTQLRDYLENCPLECNDNQPLNPSGPPETKDIRISDQTKPVRRSYVVICTHCHADHVAGMIPFLSSATTDIVASAAGRPYIEEGQEDDEDPTPRYEITRWAESFDRLSYPLDADDSDDDGDETIDKVDLGISIIQTPGHSPDELAWYDHEENHLVVGDSFYRDAANVFLEDAQPTSIIHMDDGNLIEWHFTIQKLRMFVQSENRRLAAAKGQRRVMLSGSHQTAWVDGEEIVKDVEEFAARVIEGKVPIVKKEVFLGEFCHVWRDEDVKDKERQLSLMVPPSLMVQAREFFGFHVEDE